MKHFFHVDHSIHDLGLAKISWNTVQHQRVDVRLELVRFHGGIDCLSPKFHCDVIRDELAFARVFKECFADLCARVDGSEYIATSAMIKTRERAGRLAPGTFAAARGARMDERAILHGE